MKKSVLNLRAMLCGIALLLVSSGCARMNGMTEVKPDGSATRTLVLRGSPTSGFSGPGLPDLADLPAGAGWEVKKEITDKELVVTATRTIAPGETISDLSFRDTPPQPGSPGPSGPPAKPTKPTKPIQKPKPVAKPIPVDEPPVTPQAAKGRVLVTNELTVREISPGKLEYREVLKWNGKRPDNIDKASPEFLKAMKSAFPASISSDTALVESISVDAQKEAMRLIFGPNDPLLSVMALHPDLGEYRLKQRLVKIITNIIDAKLKDRMPEAERTASIKKLTEELVSNVSGKSKAQAEGGPDSQKDESGPVVSLLFRVKMPGKVVSTNGEYDPVTGEVIWAFYTQSASIDDVVMTAVCEK